MLFEHTAAESRDESDGKECSDNHKRQHDLYRSGVVHQSARFTRGNRTLYHGLLVGREDASIDEVHQGFDAGIHRHVGSCDVEIGGTVVGRHRSREDERQEQTYQQDLGEVCRHIIN